MGDSNTDYSDNAERDMITELADGTDGKGGDTGKTGGLPTPHHEPAALGPGAARNERGVLGGLQTFI